jgi:hypothetical protein
MLSNRRGQVGETITWVVATIILIVILMIFIYASIALSKTKSFDSNTKVSAGDSEDWINSKTEIAYSVNDKNEDKIGEWILEGKENE